MFMPQRTAETPLGDPEVAVATGTSPRSGRTVTANGTELRMVAVPTASSSALVLSMPTNPVEDGLRASRNLAAAVMLAGLLASGCAARALVRRRPDMPSGEHEVVRAR